ncbi:MAG: R3H domain-containing nucleic acid-binding protein [Candidatus Altimarinota bacterium]
MVLETGRTEVLPSMSSFFRRLVHLHIKETYPQLTTYSQGDGNYRSVCIALASGSPDEEGTSPDLYVDVDFGSLDFPPEVNPSERHEHQHACFSRSGLTQSSGCVVDIRWLGGLSWSRCGLFIELFSSLLQAILEGCPRLLGASGGVWFSFSSGCSIRSWSSGSCLNGDLLTFIADRQFEDQVLRAVDHGEAQHTFRRAIREFFVVDLRSYLSTSCLGPVDRLIVSIADDGGDFHAFTQCRSLLVAAELNAGRLIVGGCGGVRGGAGIGRGCICIRICILVRILCAAIRVGYKGFITALVDVRSAILWVDFTAFHLYFKGFLIDAFDVDQVCRLWCAIPSGEATSEGDLHHISVLRFVVFGDDEVGEGGIGHEIDVFDVVKGRCASREDFKNEFECDHFWTICRTIRIRLITDADLLFLRVAVQVKDYFWGRGVGRCYRTCYEHTRDNCAENFFHIRYNIS